MSEKKERDIMDLGSGLMRDEEAFPVDNLPKTDVERPVYDQTQNSYFLNKFLEQKDETAQTQATPEVSADPSSANPETAEDAPLTQERVKARVIEALQQIYDPEIPVNIYELGLIYDVEVDDNFAVLVTMTLTTPHCPVAESMPGEVELRVNSVTGTNGAEVRLVWDPPWDMSKMSDEARLELGLL